MNDISKAIIRICTVINAHFGSIKAAYTFDAGPNAVIYTLEKDVPLVMTVMAKYFPAPGAADLYCNKPAGDPLSFSLISCTLADMYCNKTAGDPPFSVSHKLYPPSSSRMTTDFSSQC